MEISFIRHGMTKGNAEKRYIGVTDEPLSPEGIAEFINKNYPPVDFVVVSGMKRCIETAEIIYPHNNAIIDSRLNECNFGDFEGKNYVELSGRDDYQRWIESNGKLPFPNGESLESFKYRCIGAFKDIVQEHHYKKSVAFIVHGGTIMSILEAFCDNGKSYFDYMCGNADGFICTWENEKCINIRSLL